MTGSPFAVDASDRGRALRAAGPRRTCRVLLVADDTDAGTTLSAGLTELDHSVSHVSSGSLAIEVVAERQVDVVVLDLDLPDIEGTTVLAVLRSISPAPVIVLSGRGEPRDIVRAFEIGADDYVLKPCTVTQLSARLRAVHRRSPQLSTTLCLGALRIDQETCRVTLGGRAVTLPNMEYRLLDALARRPGTVIPTAELTQLLWGRTGPDAAGRLYSLLCSLRGRLGESGRRPRYLHRIRSVGVKIVDPDR